MKKKLFLAIILLLSLFSFNKAVSAETAPASIKSGTSTAITEYISGLKVYNKPLPIGGYVYCEDAGLSYKSGLDFKLVGEVNQGFVYIIENKPNTGDKNKDYYVVQAATWWYKDVLTGEHNISDEVKTYITNNRSTNAVAGYIYNLVEGAKKYNQTAGTIILNTKTISFTLKDGYYVSNEISVSTSNMKSVDKIELTNAPSGAVVFDNTFNTSGGSFKVKVPKNSIKTNTVYSFSANIYGTYEFKKVYDYYYGSGYQKIIYDKIFKKSYDTSTKVGLGIYIEEHHNELIIKKLDENGNYVKNATLSLYSGDCSKKTCSKTNLYATWLTGKTSETFVDVPVGTYTLVEEKTPAGYETASKILVNIDSDNKSYTVKMIDEFEPEDYNELNIKKLDENGNYVKDAVLSLYSGDCSKKTCSKTNLYASWLTGKTSETFVDVPVGYYTLVEETTPNGYRTAEKMLINIASSNKAYTVKMIDVKITNVRISKTNVTGDKEIPGATLVVRDSKNNVIYKWVSTDKPTYVTLEDGEYSLSETISPDGYKLNTTTINFKLEDGLVYEKVNNEWTKVSYIKMINYLNDTVNISKLDKYTNEYVVGAKLRIKNIKGDIISTYVTKNESNDISLEAGEYMLEELVAPKGYVINKDIIEFKLDEDGTLYIKNNNGEYAKANGIIMYNEKEKKEDVVIVPETGLNSTITYVIGAISMVAGCGMLIRNGKEN